MPDQPSQSLVDALLGRLNRYSEADKSFRDLSPQGPHMPNGGYGAYGYMFSPLQAIIPPGVVLGAARKAMGMDPLPQNDRMMPSSTPIDIPRPLPKLELLPPSPYLPRRNET